MINEDNACIRYLMKEMDPSEEVLMERAMMEDDDLLIEVECMRQTLKRLDQLPRVNPPAHLSDSIIKEAVEYKRKSFRSSRILSYGSIKYAAAALVVIGTTVGSLLVYNDYSGFTAEENTDLTAAKGTNTNTPEPAQQNVQAASVESQSIEGDVAPWIDRNDIIYFQDRFSENNTAFESLVKSSTEKLTPIDDPFIFNAGSRTLQLTGSGTSQ